MAAWHGQKKKTQKAKINKDLVKSEETTYRENFVNQTSDKRLISRIQKRTTAQPKRPNLKQAGGDVFVGTVDESACQCRGHGFEPGSGEISHNSDN